MNRNRKDDIVVCQIGISFVSRPVNDFVRDENPVESSIMLGPAQKPNLTVLVENVTLSRLEWYSSMWAQKLH